MKTLLLMRHAKSSWKNKELSDEERPLNKRGIKDAPRMGALLREKELIPEKILSSSARRSRETAEMVASSVDYTNEVDYLDNLYMAEAEEYIKVLQQLPNDFERVMVIGHNPGLETLLQVLSGRIESLPTAVLAHISLPITKWAELNGETEGEVIEIWRPRELSKEEEQEKEKDKVKKDKKKKAK
jgi:phosphohistidine phosphatase